MAFKKLTMALLCLGVALFFFQGTHGQTLRNVLFNAPGLQVGMHQGYTNANDQGLNYQFRLYNRNEFNSGRFGEISLSSGVISGLGYRSQLTPLEYRVGQPLSSIGFPDLNVFGQSSPPYVYAGVGVFYDRPLEIIAPSDPLTVEMGRGLQTSSFWDFEGGFAPFIPFGLGFDVPLEKDVRLSISGGYNQTLTGLKFNDNAVPKGFWGISIGLNFNRSKSDYAPMPVVTSPLRSLNEVLPSSFVQPLNPVDIKEPNISAILLKGLNQRSINFDVLSSDVQVQDRNWLEETSLIIGLNPGSQIHVKGHASATGNEQVNEMVSESRARAVWLALAESGLALEKIDYSWYGDDNPVSNNATDEGRYQNRRVEFEIRSVGKTNESYTEQQSLEDVLSIDINEPLSESDEVQFDWLRLTGDEANQIFTMVANLMENRPELHVYIGSISNESWASLRLRKEFDKARSDKITAQLIALGVHPERVSTYNPYKSDMPLAYQAFIEQGLDQQTLIIPFIPSNSEE